MAINVVPKETASDSRRELTVPGDRRQPLTSAPSLLPDDALNRLRQSHAPEPPVSDSTRYLCAGVHINPVFRASVLSELLDHSYKAMATSHGVDLTYVLKHAHAADRRVFFRNIALTVLSLGALACLGSAVGGIVVLLLLAAFGVVFGEKLIIHRHVIPRLRKGSPNLDIGGTDARLERAFARIRKEQERNVVVYSGFTPFVGAGIDLGGWSFAIKTDRGREEVGGLATPLEFELNELYERLEKDIRELRLGGLEIRDRLYTNGRDIRDDTRFLPDPLERPVAEVDRSVLEAFVNAPSDLVRHYKCVRISEWRGELIVSLFFRAVKSGNSLFIEGSYFLLTPVDETYHTVLDSAPAKTSFRRMLQLAVESMVSTPFLSAFAPIAVAYRPLAAFAKWSHRRQLAKIIENDHAFDYGATASLRAVAASPNYRRDFQKLDKERSVKTIERQVFQTLIAFLNEKNIDTSDLKERQTTVLNNGVIVSGGTIQTENFSGGQGATAVLSRLKGAARRSKQNEGRSPTTK